MVNSMMIPDLSVSWVCLVLPDLFFRCTEGDTNWALVSPHMAWLAAGRSKIQSIQPAGHATALPGTSSALGNSSSGVTCPDVGAQSLGSWRNIVKLYACADARPLGRSWVLNGHFYLTFIGVVPSGKLTCWPWKSPLVRGNSSSNPMTTRVYVHLLGF